MSESRTAPSPFPDILRKTREEKGLSQADLAEKTGFQPSAISHFEAGRRSPSFDNLRRLADALSVTIDFLLGRQPDPQPAGPAAEQLFRNFEQMTSEDQDTLNSFAKMLAEKNKNRPGGS
jgi:transcriptional regulator with XRE-family HTH domain